MLQRRGGKSFCDVGPHLFWEVQWSARSLSSRRPSFSIHASRVSANVDGSDHSSDARRDDDKTRPRPESAIAIRINSPPSPPPSHSVSSLAPVKIPPHFESSPLRGGDFLSRAGSQRGTTPLPYMVPGGRSRPRTNRRQISLAAKQSFEVWIQNSRESSIAS